MNHPLTRFEPQTRMRSVPRQGARSILLALVAAICLPAIMFAADDDEQKEPAAQGEAKTTIRTEDQPRIIDGRPYDRLKLKEEQKVLRLAPIEMEKRKPYRDPTPDFKVRVRLYDQPEQQYEVAWGDVEELKLFEELVLDEAAALVAAKKFDEAYEYYRYLDFRDAAFPGLAEAWQQCLFTEAKHRESQGRIDLAVALLNEVFARNPKHAELEPTLSGLIDRQTAALVNQGQYAAARRLVRGLAAKFPANEIVTKRQSEFKIAATQAQSEARRAKDAGQLFEAYQAANLAVAWWPALPGSKELVTEIHAVYPVLAVAVEDVGSNGDAAHSATGSFAALRRQRLLHRLLAAPTSGGGQALSYDSSLATWKADGNRLSIEVKKNIAWWTDADYAARAGAVTAYDIVATLAARTRPGQPSYDPIFASLVTRVRATSASQCEIEWTHPLARPEAWLRLPLVPWNAGDPRTLATTGSYAIEPTAALESSPSAAAAPREVRYRLRTPADPPGVEASMMTGMAREIVERRFDESSAALAALASGEVIAVDRIPPWDVERLSRTRDVAVKEYAAPSVHGIAFNPRRPLVSDRLVRRALSLGINRSRIVEELAGSGAGKTMAVISGPFPRGAAYDNAVPAFDYEPRLMLALIDAARGRGSPADQPESASLRLVMVHPPSAVARKACRAIQEQLALTGEGIQLELRELGSRTRGDDWDLAYIEWYGQDPAVDAALLLGASSAGQGHPWLDEALQRLVRAKDAAAATKILYEIHRLVHDELPIIPLWEVQEHFAVSTALTGVERDNYTLYQTIEAWRHPPRLPSE